MPNHRTTPRERAPIVLAFPLDYGAEDVIDAAAALAARLDAPVLPVHALDGTFGARSPRDERRRERDTIEAWLEPLTTSGVSVQPPIVEHAPPEQLVPTIAARVGSALTIVGSGRGSTVVDWLLGSTAERIVRASASPVWIARGTLPGPRSPVLVPVDLGQETRLAITAGRRWAQLFGAPLRIVHVLPEVPLGAARSASAIDALEHDARARIAEALEQAEVDGAEVYVAHGPVGSTLLREAENAGLVVLVQPDYDMLVPASIGSRTERLVRASRCSVVALRDADGAQQRALREERAAWVATLRRDAEDALRAGDPARAERILVGARLAAPASPRVEEALARAIESQGRLAEADEHRALARWLRAELE